MNPIIKQIIAILLLVSTVLTVFIVSVIRSKKEGIKDDAERLLIVKNIQFKGKVISYKTFDFGGRTSYMVCLKLDYSNLTSFYALNRLCFIKIKAGVATMAVGHLDQYYGIPTYVEVNINNDGMEHYTYPGGKSNTFDLSLANYDLTEKDLNTCN